MKKMKLLFRVLTAGLLLSMVLGGMGIPLKVQADDPVVIEIAETISVTDSPEVVPQQVVNHAPTVANPIPDQQTSESEAFSYTLPANTFDDVDLVYGDSLTYTATLVGGYPLPAFLTFNAGTATFSSSPDYNSAGYYDIEVTATDQSGASVSDTFRITVINTNRAPEFVITPDQSLYTVDEKPAAALIITVSFSDPDGDTVTVQASGLPAFVTASPAFPGTTSPVTLTIDPSCTDVGVYSIALTAADDDPVDPKSVSKILNIQVNQTNCPGTLALSADNPPLTINENSTANYKLALTDPEGDGIASVTIVSQQPDDALNATAIKIGDDWYVSVTADYNAAKQNASQDYTITVQAIDTGSPAGVLSNQLPVTVTVNNINGPPVLDPIGNQTVNEGQILEFTVSASDPDAEDIMLWFTALPIPSGATFDSYTQRFVWMPGYDQAGTYTIHFVVYDRDPAGVPTGLTDSEEITITVNDVTPSVTVRLVDSHGTGIEGGVVKYYSGVWQDFGTTGVNGEVQKSLPLQSYKFRMTYAGAYNDKTQNVGVDPVVVFQTINVSVQLKDSGGNLIDTGEVKYNVGGWKDFGTTSGGQVSMELLPYSYKFRMTYAGAYNDKTQNVGVDPVVVFQTVNVTVQLKDSGDNLIDTGEVKYNAGGWKDFGTTSGGQVSKELLPNSYKFRMTYAGAYNDKTQNVGVDPVVVFQTINVTVQLKDSGGSLIDTGDVKYSAGGWKDFGTTSGGQVSMELLPSKYKFRMTYAGASNEKYQNVGVDPVVVFQTGQVVSVSGACTHYYAGGWQVFTSGMELLPNTYKFRFNDGTRNTTYTITSGIVNNIH